jgi:hypothetical protein
LESITSLLYAANKPIKTGTQRTGCPILIFRAAEVSVG